MARNYYSDLVDRRTCVYRFYDADGSLLYVGLSVDFIARMSAHKRKPWWPEVTRAEVQWYEGREAAKAAERAAIINERPRHNVTGRPQIVVVS